MAESYMTEQDLPSSRLSNTYESLSPTLYDQPTQ